MTEDFFELLPKANFTKRILATFIDYSIFFSFLIFYVTYMGEDNGVGGKILSGLPVIGIPIFWFTYFVLVESLYGGTLAHVLLKLKILTLKRTEIDFSHAFKRRLLDFIDIFFYGIPALIAIKSSEKHQRIGDMWAGTIVVDMNDPEQFSKNPTNTREIN
jgi:uncharacterized RDD family membrane protein YckC